MDVGVPLQSFYRKKARDRRLRRPHLNLYVPLLVQSKGSGGYLYYLPSYNHSSQRLVCIKPMMREGAATASS